VSRYRDAATILNTEQAAYSTAIMHGSIKIELSAVRQQAAEHTTLVDFVMTDVTKWLTLSALKITEDYSHCVVDMFESISVNSLT